MQGNWTNATQYQDRYTYNHKEQVTEIEWFAYGARYYDAKIGRFAGVDPIADAPLNVGTSPNAYVWDNPLKFIDPTGMLGESFDDDYGIDKSGRIKLLRKTDDKTDKLIALDSDGNETDKSVEVSKGILGQLDANHGKLKVNTLWGEKSGTYANTGKRV